MPEPQKHSSWAMWELPEKFVDQTKKKKKSLEKGTFHWLKRRARWESEDCTVQNAGGKTTESHRTDYKNFQKAGQGSKSLRVQEWALTRCRVLVKGLLGKQMYPKTEERTNLNLVLSGQKARLVSNRSPKTDKWGCKDYHQKASQSFMEVFGITGAKW